MCSLCLLYEYDASLLYTVGTQPIRGTPLLTTYTVTTLFLSGPACHYVLYYIHKIQCPNLSFHVVAWKSILGKIKVKIMLVSSCPSHS